MNSTSSGFPLLEAKSPTPIASLHPDLPDQASRAVTGEVTLVWPYNSATKSLAFLLAEPDVRLRRDKGQVRIQLLGSSAKAVADIRLGGGDSVAIALDGVDWVKDNSVVRVPGSRVDWQLQFSEKLILQARIGDQRELKDINVDHPERDISPPDAETIQPAAETAQMAAAPDNGEPIIPVINSITMELEEYPSPAFIKRARLSYGALFEGGDDNFEEDGGVRGRGRKRTRFGRDSSSWRYTSQSPSPTPESEPDTPPHTADAAVEVDVKEPSPLKPPMADEGCQTMDIDTAPAPKEAPVVEAPSGDELRREDQHTSPTQDQPSQPSHSPKTQMPVGRQEDGQARKSPVLNQPEPDKLSTVSGATASPSKFGSTTLFGNLTASDSGYDRPRFGTASPAGGGGLGIANQVRFGFSHTPQTAHPQPPQVQAEQPRQPQLLSHSAPAPHQSGEDYPITYLKPSDPSKYADMETYVNQAEQEMETEPHYVHDGQDLNPPASGSFGEGQFDIATQSQGYNPVEGGHFGADALVEGTRITTDGYALHNDEIDAGKVPPGFASFSGGHGNEVAEEDFEEEDEYQPQIAGEDFVDNDELMVLPDIHDEVAVDDEDDPDAEYGPEGEIIEQGDYDQRQYYTPDDDQEELSEEEHQNELEAVAQDNSPAVIDEDELYNRIADDQSDEDEEGSGDVDDGQGSYDEEDEGFDEDDDQGSFNDEEGSTEASYSDGAGAFYDNTSQTWVPRGQAQMQPAAHAATSAPKSPVFIDLLSSDDDEPPAQPVKQAVPLPAKPKEDFVSAPSEPVKQDPSRTLQNLNAGDQHDPVLEPSPAPEQRCAQNERTRRKSSGSHLYGEHTEEPPDDSNMDLHLPSTPPPEKQEASASVDAGIQEEAVSHTDAKHDVTDVSSDEGNAATSIPSLDGAAESREGDRDPKPAEATSPGERGEDGPSVIASSVLRAAPNQQEKGAVSPEAAKDGRILPSQKIHDSENQQMADAVAQHVSSPPRSLGDADETEAGPDSSDIQNRDVDEVERLFDEYEPDRDITMGHDNQVDRAPAQDSTETPQDTTPQSDKAVESQGVCVTTGLQETVRGAVNNQDEKTGRPQNAPSSPPHSQSFASQVFSSSPPPEGGLDRLPTPMETQPSQAFISQTPTSDIAQIPSSSDSEPAQATVPVTETTVETHVHVEQQVAIPAEDDQGDISNPDVDVDMADAPAEDGGAPSPVAEQTLALTADLDVEDEMDVEHQIQAQLQVEIVRTIVQGGQDQLHVVQERTRVSVSHASSMDVSGAEETPVPDQDADQPVENIPVEPASLDDAIQEELMLQDTVEHEIASEFGGEGDAPADVGDDNEVEDDDEMEDLPEVVAEEEVDDGAVGAEDEPFQEEATAPEVTQEENTQVEATLDEEALDNTAQEDEAEHHGTPQPEPDKSVEPTIGVLSDDDEVVLIGETDAPQPESTVSAVPQEEELAPLGEDNAPEQPDVEDTNEAMGNTTPQKPKQELEVLIRPQTRSRRARDQQSQSVEAASQDDVSARETTKELSPDVSKGPRRATGGSKRSKRAKETRDPSIELAKASIQKRGVGRKGLEPVALEPRRTRQRSASLQAAASSQPTATSEIDEEEDSSVALAKAALESPSKKAAEHASPTETTSRADLLRRLRITLAEFTPLRSLRHHKKGHPHILAVVACDPLEPLRTKHRDFHTTVTVTDASVAPDQVVEVQFSDLHKAYLPAVKQGDTMVLRNFEIVSLPGREFALRQRDEESSWAVYDADYEVPGGKGGPDFEIQQQVKDYLHDLRVWYADLDVLDREKLATAVTKLLAETACGEKSVIG